MRSIRTISKLPKVRVNHAASLKKDIDCLARSAPWLIRRFLSQKFQKTLQARITKNGSKKVYIVPGYVGPFYYFDNLVKEVPNHVDILADPRYNKLSIVGSIQEDADILSSNARETEGGGVPLGHSRGGAIILTHLHELQENSPKYLPDKVLLIAPDIHGANEHVTTIRNLIPPIGQFLCDTRRTISELCQGSPTLKNIVNNLTEETLDCIHVVLGGDYLLDPEASFIEGAHNYFIPGTHGHVAPVMDKRSKMFQFSKTKLQELLTI